MQQTPTGWTCHGTTISDLMARAVRGHLECPTPDAVLNIETHLFNSTLVADSCAYDLDIGKHVWLNQGRWSRLIKEYVPKEPLDRFVEQACEIVSGAARDGATANMFFRDPDRYAKKHRWGGCLMGATFRGNGWKAGKPTITFYSRTTYIGYMGLLDAAIAHTMARAIIVKSQKIWRGAGVFDLDKIAFRWHISSQQLHCFKTLPYIYSQGDLMAKLEKSLKQKRLVASLPPTWKYLTKWYEKVVNGWFDYSKGMDQHESVVQQWLLTEKYGPFRRVKRRWCEHQKLLNKHLPPTLLAINLNFDKAV